MSSFKKCTPIQLSARATLKMKKKIKSIKFRVVINVYCYEEKKS